MAGIVELADLAGCSAAVEAPDFSRARVSRMVVFPAAAPAALRPLAPGTEHFADAALAARHGAGVRPAARDVACYFAVDAIVGGRSGQIWIDNRLVVTDELLPAYEYTHGLELPDKPAQVLKTLELPVRVVERPCLVLPGDKLIYGHFLIETLPALLTARRALAGAGLDCAVLLPVQSATWLPGLLGALGVGPEMIEVYDRNTERVRLRRAVLPAMVRREGGFHPATNQLLADVLPGLPPVRPAPRLFLTRHGFASYDSRRCVNEEALAQYAQSRHGFAVVAMETLPWREQIGLWRQARIVTGLYGSALHGALFAPAGTVVAALGVGNFVQAEIAALRGQRLACLTRGFEMRGEFTIDEVVFAGFLGAVCGEFVS